MLLNCFAGTPFFYVIEELQLNTPPSIWQNLLCATAFWAAAFGLGFLCLYYLYRERR